MGKLVALALAAAGADVAIGYRTQAARHAVEAIQELGRRLLRARVRTDVRVLRGEGGILAFSKALAREVGRYGITVNVVAPAVIDDPELSVPQTRRHKAAGTAVARPGTGADVAAACCISCRTKPNS